MTGRAEVDVDAPPIDLRLASAAELIRGRFRAFAAGDFGFIYDSYHPEALFRQHFPDRATYLAYGRSTLSADFRIRECRILKEQVAGAEASVLFYLDILHQGKRVESFELASLLRTEAGWRYCGGEKLAREEFAGEIGEIDWKDFAGGRDKVFF